MGIREFAGGPRLGLLAVLVLVVANNLLGSAGPGSAIGIMQQREHGQPAASTPIATAPESDDPLDGDPLDGDPVDADSDDTDPPRQDAGAPEDLTALDIERSGRPSQEPQSLSSYDDDPATAWQPGATSGETWVWFDLGTEQRTREVRWLAEGQGSVYVSVSGDRRRWEVVERIDVDGEWQGVALREDARYVRLTLLADADEAPPALAEVAIYGRTGRDSVSVKQEAGRDLQRRQDRADRDDESGSQDEGAATNGNTSGTDNGGDRTRRRGGRVQVSTAPGETRCSGDRERCRARQGEVSVEEDCAEEGSCIIDVRADGGTAICDATGGDESRAGRGEGRRGADGGACEAVANGGAVAIGDINP